MALADLTITWDSTNQRISADLGYPIYVFIYRLNGTTHEVQRTWSPYYAGSFIDGGEYYAIGCDEQSRPLTRPSNTITYTKPTTPSLSVSGTTVRINHPSSGDSNYLLYGYYRGTGTIAQTYRQNTDIFYNVQRGLEYKGMYRSTQGFDSERSSSVWVPYKLDAPSLKQQNDYIVWNAVPNCSRYTVWNSAGNKVQDGGQLNYHFTTSGYYTVYAEAPNDNYESTGSNISVQVLPSISISISGKRISWSASFYNSFQIYLNSSHIDTTTNSYYDLNTVGQYYIVGVASVGSKQSNSVTYRDYLSTPIISLTSRTTFAWESVENAVKYEIIKQGYGQIGFTTNLSYTTNELGTYGIRAVPEEGSYYYTSQLSNQVNVVALSDISLSLNGTTLTWTTTTSYSSYDIYNGNVKVATTTNKTYTISTVGEYTVKGHYGEEIVTSNSVTYHEQLDTPTISLSGNEITWNSITHATSYEIYLNNQLLTTVTSNTYSVTDKGYYYIVAKDGEYYYSSDNSNKVYYRPTPDSKFDIILYSNSAEQHRVNKTDYLTQKYKLTGVLRDSSSIISPSITVNVDYGIVDCNYAYVEVFNRYYFITDITSIRFGLWQITLSCDVLMSFKEEILNLSPIVKRNEFEYNDLIRDDLLPFTSEVRRSRQVIHNPSTEFINSWNDNAYQYIITCLSNSSTGNVSTVKTFRSNMKYIVNRTQLNSLMDEMNTTNFANAVKNLFGNEPMNAIISVRAYPFVLPTTSLSLEDIYLGTYHTNIQGYRFEQADTLSLSFLGYIDLTSEGLKTWIAYNYDMKLYLPFVGFVPLPAQEVLGKYVGIYMIVDYDTGNMSVGIYSTTNTNNLNSPDFEENDLFMLCSGTVGIDIPLSQLNNKDFILNMTLGALEIGTNFAMGNITGALGGVEGILRNDMKFSKATTYSGGAFSSLYFNIVPFLDIYYQVPKQSTENYKSLYGKPLYETRLLSSLSGYTVIDKIHLDNFSFATKPELDTIETKLLQGVIL